MPQLPTPQPPPLPPQFSHFHPPLQLPVNSIPNHPCQILGQSHNIPYMPLPPTLPPLSFPLPHNPSFINVPVVHNPHPNPPNQPYPTFLLPLLVHPLPQVPIHRIMDVIASLLSP